MIHFFQYLKKSAIKTIVVALLVLTAQIIRAQTEEVIEEVLVIGITPNVSQGVKINRIPFAVQHSGTEALQTSQSLDVSDFMNSRLNAININSAQNNPLQADVQFRGFTASPLLGLPQGLAVYQDGVRLNEPLGDAVNWDLIPESAVYSIDLLSGANPIFGLNALGGALTINMKNGFNFTGNEAEIYAGSWGRTMASFESGGSKRGWGYYFNVNRFSEEGWRDLSQSDATNFYGSLSWRDSDTSSVDLIYQTGKTQLIGNGALPVGLLSLDRSAVFTAPDITSNDMSMFNLNARHVITKGIEFSGNTFWRENNTNSFNGDGSEFELCEYAGGVQSFFEESEELKDSLSLDLGVELEDICGGGNVSITNYKELQNLIYQKAQLYGLDPEDFELKDVIGKLYGSGVLSDEAINNISHRRQVSTGLNLQVAMDEDFFGFDNNLTAGFSYFAGDSGFVSVLELAQLDPITRSTAGLGTGTFYQEGETDVFTEINTWSLFFTDTWAVTDQLALIFAGRYNEAEVVLRDRSGERPELNGSHKFTRFNPAIGFTFDESPNTNFFGVYSEANRVPTPIELACNEGVFTLAQQYASESGEDSDDIDFECRLPNAFLADPPLEEVVTNNLELGVRGNWRQLNYQLGIFNAKNENDILFQTTGRSTGLFANVGETKRRGLEVSIRSSSESFDFYATYSLLNATFQKDFYVLSPNHPNSDLQGELAVQSGDRIPGLPEHIIKLGGDYRFTPQLSMGAEAIYNSNQVIRGDESNQLGTIGGYSVVNLRASYLLKDRFILFARVTNLFDKEFENFGLLGESPSEILPDLADQRPLFLGIGAPRGAWLGVRYSF